MANHCDLIDGGRGRQRASGHCNKRRFCWWAREDSNLQPDRYERSALTIELRARCASSPGTGHTTRMRSEQMVHIRNSRLALPLRIFALSSSQSATEFIQSTAGLLGTNGQSTANRMRSMPTSITQHNSAGLEKLPLV